MFWMELRSLFEVLFDMNSNPPKEQGNTDAGAKRFDTYDHLVKVRVGAGKNLGFLLNDDGAGKKLKGEVYG